MEQTTQYKQCPQCGQLAPLPAPSCAHCGRVYRTQFAPPEDQTRLYTAPPQPAPVMPSAMPGMSNGMPGMPNSVPAMPAPAPSRNGALTASLVIVTLIIVVGMGMMLIGAFQAKHAALPRASDHPTASVEAPQDSRESQSGQTGRDSPSKDGSPTAHSSETGQSSHAAKDTPSGQNAPGGAASAHLPLGALPIAANGPSSKHPTEAEHPHGALDAFQMDKKLGADTADASGTRPAPHAKPDGKAEILPCGHPRADHGGKNAAVAVCEVGEIFQRSENHWVPMNGMELQGRRPATGSVPPADFNMLSRGPAYAGPVQKATPGTIPRR